MVLSWRQSVARRSPTNQTPPVQYLGDASNLDLHLEASLPTCMQHAARRPPRHTSGSQGGGAASRHHYRETLSEAAIGCCLKRLRAVRAAPRLASHKRFDSQTNGLAPSIPLSFSIFPYSTQFCAVLLSTTFISMVHNLVITTETA